MPRVLVRGVLGNYRSWLSLGFARLLNCPRSKDRGYEFPVSASWTVPIRIIATSFSSWIIGTTSCATEI
ncbi:MAG: hypothetical protein AB7T22_10875 [Calditrichaceae bacterium]